jgi:sugar phosphate isomerase/epimerase
MNRRHFIQAAAAGALAPAGAVEPFKRAGKPRLLASLAAYSFRETFAKNPARLDMFKFVDYCADQGLAGAEVTSYYFPKTVDEQFCLRLKRHAFLRGIALSGTAVGNNFALPRGEARDREIASVKSWIDRAALMGAPHIRVFAGGPPDGFSVEAATRECIAALEECGAHAASRGVFLGVENHGGIVAEPEGLLTIIRAVQSPWVGINLDTGNFHTGDPYASLVECAPFAVNAQVKTEIRPKGRPVEEADMARLIKLLRDAGYQGFVALEYEAREDPWAAVPRHLERLKTLCG